MVPVLNENDSVSAEGVQIGENDRLASVVASKLDADVLLSLSDVAGYYNGDPHHDPKARADPGRCARSRAEMERAGGRHGRAGGPGRDAHEGGGREAGDERGRDHGDRDGREPDVIRRIMAGEDVGTIFLPKAGEAARPQALDRLRGA